MGERVEPRRDASEKLSRGHPLSKRVFCPKLQPPAGRPNVEHVALGERQLIDPATCRLIIPGQAEKWDPGPTAALEIDGGAPVGSPEKLNVGHFQIMAASPAGT